MQGLHVTADLFDCCCAPALLVDSAALEALCRQGVAASGLTIVDHRFFTFPSHDGHPGGVTGAVLLAESHLAVHTWPERAGVTLDVYVCNFSTDNSARAQQLLDDLVAAFAPQRHERQRILRGGELPAGASRAELLLESLDANAVYGLRSHALLESVRSPYQQIEVYDTPGFGRLFRLDGDFMTSEKDEFFYHENLIHPAALTHAGPRRALVLGGGDGGSAEELLKHPTMERVVIAELDPLVIEIARRHLGAVHRGALDDPRVDVRITDGRAFVEGTDERFDLVVLDLTDPDTPASALYSPAFFASLKAVLAPGGAVTLHIGSPVFQPDLFARLLRDLRSVFAVVRPFCLYIPLYGSLWGMASASDTLDPLTLETAEAGRRLEVRRIGDLRYYNAEVHGALFALPGFVRDLAG